MGRRTNEGVDVETHTFIRTSEDHVDVRQVRACEYPDTRVRERNALRTFGGAYLGCAGACAVEEGPTFVFRMSKNVGDGATQRHTAPSTTDTKTNERFRRGRSAFVSRPCANTDCAIQFYKFH